MVNIRMVGIKMSCCEKTLYQSLKFAKVLKLPDTLEADTFYLTPDGKNGFNIELSDNMGLKTHPLTANDPTLDAAYNAAVAKGYTKTKLEYMESMIEFIQNGSSGGSGKFELSSNYW